MIGYMKGDASIVYYDFFGILISGICLFELLQRIKNIKFGNLFTYISKISLALFFVHRPILYILKRYLTLPFMPCLNYIILYIINFILSIIIVIILAKSKFIKKYLFIVKE